MKYMKPGTGEIVTEDGRVVDFLLGSYSLPLDPNKSGAIEISGTIKPRIADLIIEDFFSGLIPKDSSLAPLFGCKRDERPPKAWDIDHIIKSGSVTIVFWADGTKTMVRRALDEEDNDYAAFTAALAIKIYGSNSALKKMLKQKVKVQKLKKKSTECTDTCPIDFDAIERNLAAAKTAKTPEEAGRKLADALDGRPLKWAVGHPTATETVDELKKIVEDPDGLFGKMGIADAVPDDSAGQFKEGRINGD